MNFKCPLCDSLFDEQDALGEHVKEAHVAYYYDTYLQVPVVLNDLALIGTTPITVHTSPPSLSAPDEVDAETDGCCCCCDDDDLCGCGDMCDMCGCGGCCGLGACGDCCDCGDCFGCGDCIGCADCPSCCTFDCSIM